MKSAWDVLFLFLVPIGGGIPAGVVLAKARGLHWALMMLLYFISDVILACVFDPAIWLLKKSQFFKKVGEAFRKSLEKTILKPGLIHSPLSLILISFGVDPMSGRVAAAAAGHGFLSGWALVIIGDMMFFTLIMVSTLWLNDLLGNGTWAAVIITVAMLGIPAIVKKRRRNTSANV